MPGFCATKKPKSTDYFKINPDDAKTESVAKDMQKVTREIKDADPVDATTFVCDLGQPERCYNKAIKMHYGKSVSENKSMAHRIFSELCGMNIGKACHAASMAIDQYSDRPDYYQYVEFHLKGCENGFSNSCFLLGRSFEGPWHPDAATDHVKAKRYFKRACKLGNYLGCQYAKVKATGHRLRRK